jgi:hypothetical protein
MEEPGPGVGPLQGIQGGAYCQMASAFGCYPGDNGEPWRILEQGSDRVGCAFGMIFFLQHCVKES